MLTQADILGLSFEYLLRDTTRAYLQSIQDKDLSSQEITQTLLKLCNQNIDIYNLGYPNPNASKDAPLKEQYPNQRKGSDKYNKLKQLAPVQIAEILIHRHHASLLQQSKDDTDKSNYRLGIYQSDGVDQGLYITDIDKIKTVIRSYSYAFLLRYLDDVLSALEDLAPCKIIEQNKDLIPVNNGIFNYKTKTIQPFSPDIVFTQKSRVNYIDNPTNPIITMPDGLKWDVVSWFNDLSDDDQITQLLWEITGAILRPNVSWDKTAWLYSDIGSNGKGTFCTLLRNLCGTGNWASVPISDMSKDFMLSPIVDKSAIIVDENDVGDYIDKIGNLKAIVTHDTILINRKYKDPISYRFKGFMVQCLNEYPKVRDRSSSFYRRQLFIPMTKQFQGIERKYIKDDYLYRQDVLEYVLYHILHDTNYYQLSCPKACQDMLLEYQKYNDPLREFYESVEANAKWDLLPFDFLYAWYKSWYRQNYTGTAILSKNKFCLELKSLVDKSMLFTYQSNPVQAKYKITTPEPMILKYDLKEWKSTTYHGSDLDQICIPTIDEKQRWRGLIRKQYN